MKNHYLKIALPAILGLTHFASDVIMSQKSMMIMMANPIVPNDASQVNIIIVMMIPIAPPNVMLL